MVKIKNALFCELAVEKGLLTRVSMVEALKYQIELTKKDKHVRIGTILVDKGFMSPENVLKILESQNVFIYKCSACGKQFNIPFADQKLNYFCLRDDELLSKVSTDEIRSVKVDGIVHYSMGFPSGFSPLDKNINVPILNRDEKKKPTSQTSNTKFNYEQVQLDSERLKAGTSLYSQQSQTGNLVENTDKASRRDKVQLDPKILAAMDKGEKTASMRKEMMSKKLIQREFEVKPDKVDTAQIKAYESMNFEFKTTEVSVESEFQQEDVVQEYTPTVQVDNLEVLAEKALDKIDKISTNSQSEEQDLQSEQILTVVEKMPVEDNVKSDIDEFDLPSDQLMTIIEKKPIDEELDELNLQTEPLMPADEVIEKDRMILAESVSSDSIIPTHTDEKESDESVADDEITEKTHSDDEIVQETLPFEEQVEESTEPTDENPSESAESSEEQVVESTEPTDEESSESVESIDEQAVESNPEDAQNIDEQAVVPEDSTQQTKSEDADSIEEYNSEKMIVDEIDFEVAEEKKQAKLRLSEVLRLDSFEGKTENVDDDKIADNEVNEVNEDKDVTKELEQISEDDEESVNPVESLPETDAMTEENGTESDAVDEIEDGMSELKSLDDVNLGDLLKNDFTPPDTDDTEFAIVTRKDGEIEIDEQGEHIPPKDSDTLLEIKLTTQEKESSDSESADEEIDDKKKITSEKKITEDTTKRNDIPAKFRDMSSDAAININNKINNSVSDVDQTKKDLKDYLTDVENKIPDKRHFAVDEPETETMELYPNQMIESEDDETKLTETDELDDTKNDSEATDICEILKDSSTELYFREKNDYDDIDFDIEALDEMLSKDLGIDEFEETRKDVESLSILTKTMLDDSELEYREEVNIPERFATDHIKKLGPPDEPYEEYEINFEMPKTGFAKFYDTLKKALVNFIKKFDSET